MSTIILREVEGREVARDMCNCLAFIIYGGLSRFFLFVSSFILQGCPSEQSLLE